MIVRVDPEAGLVWLRLQIATVCVWTFTLGDKGNVFAQESHPPTNATDLLLGDPADLTGVEGSWVLIVERSLDGTKQAYTGLVELVQAATLEEATTTNLVIYSSATLPKDEQPTGEIKPTDKSHMINSQLSFRTKAAIIQLVANQTTQEPKI